MSRPTKPWLLPVASAVIGVGWLFWLARGVDPPIKVPADGASSVRSPPQAGPGERPDGDSAGSRSARDAGVPSAAQPKDTLQSSTEPSLQLDFQTPASARVGDGFDIRVAIAARKAIGRIVVEVAYDPAQLKVRTAEEIDYAERAPGERAFSIQQGSEGHVELILQRKRGETALALPVSVPLVQFEALAPGWAEVRIANITASDATNRPVPWSAAGRETQIVVN